MLAAKKAKKADKKHPIIIVGGGPAGMTAAETAVQHYTDIILFDKNPQPGKKLLSLSGDPVFVSEELSIDKLAKAFGDKENFIKPALKAFGWKDVANHFNEMGIKIKSNSSSHLTVSPEMVSELSSRLKGAAESKGVSVRKSSRVSDILISNDEVTGVVVNAVEYPASAVVVASGSFSSPSRGSTRDGYEFAKKAGHTIIPIRAALVGLETVEKYGKYLADAQFADCAIDVYLNNTKVISDRGSLKFTNFGLEGELILTYSAEIIDLLKKGKVKIHIDMAPDMDKKVLETWLYQQLIASPKMTVGEMLEKYIPLKLRNVMSKIMRIHSDKPVANLSHLERKSLLLWLKDFQVTVMRARPFNETKGVLGGVSTDEIDRETMRSKFIKNLFFAGEVLDLLGPWGGYNIQMAFSTGHLAGLSAAKMMAD